MPVPELSVIIGAQNAHRSIQECLNALTAQISPNVEIIVVDGSTDDTAEIVAANFPQVKLLRADPKVLVPQLWKMGLDIAQGSIIAFTIAQCIPTTDWLAHIQEASKLEWAGIGGPIDAPLKGTRVDWALYFARYTAYLPTSKSGEVDEIPGDNAAYKRSALAECTAVLAGGFWETLVHARLHALGQHLAMIPEMSVQLGSTTSLSTIAGLRFRHGRHYGSTRPGNTLPKRLARLAVSPLILPTLIGRIRGRIKQQKPEWLPYLNRSLPALLVILSAWTLGEVSGYVSPQRQKNSAISDVHVR